MAFAHSADHLDGDEVDFADFVLPYKARSFLYRVPDDSLRSAGILQRDFIVIERNRPLRAGRVALVNIDGSARLVQLRTEHGRCAFDGVPSESTMVDLLGIASRVVRPLLPPFDADGMPRIRR
jgi:SOS-response transcriptional repressor LexA